jgi:glycosyltransferase involved in cell wall biosynthesis
MSDRAASPGQLVAVIIPVRDCERYVHQAVDSMLTQTAVPREIVVVDDGSSDRTPDILARYRDPVRVVRQEPVNQFAALNHGIAVSTAPVLAFLDADDIAPPGSLAARLARLLAADAPEAVVGRTVQFVSPELEPAQAARLRFDPEPQHVELLPSMLVRRATFERVGPLRTDLATSASIEWVSRARAAGVRSVTVPDLVTRRRLHTTNAGITRAASKHLDLLEVVRAHRHRVEATGPTSPRTCSAPPESQRP